MKNKTQIGYVMHVIAAVLAVATLFVSDRWLVITPTLSLALIVWATRLHSQARTEKHVAEANDLRAQLELKEAGEAVDAGHRS